MPPVSSYVGYSIEEPWGRPRVVFGVNAEDAERLAALLQESAGSGPGELSRPPEPGHREPGYRPPVRGGFAAERTAVPDRGYDQSLLDDVRGRIPVQGWPPEFSDSREQLNSAGPSHPDEPELPLDLGPDPDSGQETGRMPGLRALGELGLSDEFRPADDLLDADESPAGAEAPYRVPHAGSAPYGVPYTGEPYYPDDPYGTATSGQPYGQATSGERAGDQAGDRASDPDGEPDEVAGPGESGPAGHGDYGAAGGYGTFSGYGDAGGYGAAGVQRPAGRPADVSADASGDAPEAASGDVPRAATARVPAQAVPGEPAMPGEDAPRDEAGQDAHRGPGQDASARNEELPDVPGDEQEQSRSRDGQSGPAPTHDGPVPGPRHGSAPDRPDSPPPASARLAPAGPAGPGDGPRPDHTTGPAGPAPAGPVPDSPAADPPADDAAGGPAASSGLPADSASRGSITDTMAAELAGWAAGELPGQAAARLASWASAGGAVARSRQQTRHGGGGTAAERVS